MTHIDETRLYDTLTEGEDGAPPSEARNGLRHVASLSMTKLADGLINPKLVLTWLAQTLGAPAAITGLLVPIREAGALLPQLLLAGVVRRSKQRKWVWVAGSVGQGLAAAAMVVVALTLQGVAAGIALCVLLGLLALSRAAASVSYKDVLGKTVSKTRRGSITGTAGSVASAGVVVFALLLMSGLLQDVPPIAVAIGHRRGALARGRCAVLDARGRGQRARDRRAADRSVAAARRPAVPPLHRLPRRADRDLAGAALSCAARTA